MHRRAPVSSTRSARNAPCSGATCMPCPGRTAVSSRSRASTSGSRVPTATTYAASSSEMPIVLLAMLWTLVSVVRRLGAPARGTRIRVPDVLFWSRELRGPGSRTVPASDRRGREPVPTGSRHRGRSRGLRAAAVLAPAHRPAGDPLRGGALPRRAGGDEPAPYHAADLVVANGLHRAGPDHDRDQPRVARPAHLGAVEQRRHGPEPPPRCDAALGHERDRLRTPLLGAGPGRARGAAIDATRRAAQCRLALLPGREPRRRRGGEPHRQQALRLGPDLP